MDDGRQRKKKVVAGDPHPTRPDLPPSTREQRDRVRELGGERPVPPLSWGVEIDESEGAKNTATFYDLAGRKQYIRSAAAASEANANKFASLSSFSKNLGKVRWRVARDLAQEGTPKTRALAAIVKLIDLTAMRVGGEEYAAENGTFGASSLRRSHVFFDPKHPSWTTVRFVGKHKQVWERTVKDKALTDALRAFHAVGEEPGDEAREDSPLFPVSENQVRDYLKPLGVIPKQFRTYHATRLAAGYLLALEPTDDPKAREANVAAAAKSTAGILGNTPAVCRSSYISPEVIEAYKSGNLSKLKDMAKSIKI